MGRLPRATAGLWLTVAVAGCSGSHHGQHTGAAAHRPRPAVVALAFRVEPFVGVTCTTPNTVACDRLGVAVRLRRRASAVAAWVNGLRVPMRPFAEAAYPAGTDFWGHLSRRGLFRGPVKVTPDRPSGQWFGGHPVNVRVRVSARLRNGATGTRTVTVLLHPGFG